MSDLIAYLIAVVAGYALGALLRKKKDRLGFVSGIQSWAVLFLVFSMGMRMGANPEVINNLKSIGLYSLFITLIILVCSVAAMSFTRRLLGFDRYGFPIKKKRAASGEGPGQASGGEEAETPAEADNGGGKPKVDKMTLIILFAVFLGLMTGGFIIPRITSDLEWFDGFASHIISIGLCVLLWFVGLDLGLEGTVFGNSRESGLKVFIFPVATIVGTMIGAAICGLILPLSMKDSLLIGAGFGWYSLAPGMIIEAGLVTTSAISFMHNVMRELLSVVLMPIVARRIGYIETFSMPGAASMDVCLPIVERATNGQTAVYSFINGLILSFVVPVLIQVLLQIG
ncbi:MAG: lysine exporter LysO family protein [Eubacterium sp.]|nr:lysine exporter LysO family protein [Eubacterium sp.]